MYPSLCGHRHFLDFSFLLGTYIGMEFLGHMVNLCFASKKLSSFFPKWLHHLGTSLHLGTWLVPHFLDEDIETLRGYIVCQDLTGFKFQTWESNPDWLSLQPILLTTRRSCLLLLFFPRKWEPLMVLICVSLVLKNPGISAGLLGSLYWGSLGKLNTPSCNSFPWPHKPACLETTKHLLRCQGFCSSLRMCRVFFTETVHIPEKSLSVSSMA